VRRLLEPVATGTPAPNPPGAGALGATVPATGAAAPTVAPTRTSRLPPDPAAATEAVARPAAPPGWGAPLPAGQGRRRRGREQLPGWTSPPRRRPRWGRRLVVAAGVLLVLAVASNLGDERRGGAGPAGVGDPVRDGQFEFVVRSVDCGAGPVGEGIGRKSPLGQFCLVGLRVENTGKEGRTFGGGHQYLFDDAGKRHDPDLDATVRHGGERLLSTHLNPGQRLEGTLVYDVPDPITLARVELHDAAFSGGVSVGLG
jgi:hypothetical protein